MKNGFAKIQITLALQFALPAKPLNNQYNGLGAVRKHAEGTGHKALANDDSQTTLNFPEATTEIFRPSLRETDLLIAIVSAPTKSVDIPTAQVSSYMLSQDAMKAEIVWAINRIMCHSSLRGGEESSNLFPIMFPDSAIASKFQMKKDKLAYIATYGIGPFFQNRLAQEVSLCPFYSISFDESLNKVSQKGQMDLVVRYWDCKSDEVATRYLTSNFLGHACASDLLKAFMSAITDLGLRCERIIQISMDGPNVNFAFLKDFEKTMNVAHNGYNNLIDIGSCSLHIIHGAYKYAHNKTTCKLNNFLRSAYYLFKDFPSRRADYTRFSESSKFPKKMGSIRWVENSSVINCAIDVIPHIKIYIDGVKNKPPQSKNFAQVSEFVKDDFLLAKLHFMLTVTTELEPFLRMFQSNKPLLPFLYTELMTMLKNIMKRFIIAKVMDLATTNTELMKVDVKEKENYIAINKIDVGFGARAQLPGKNERDVLSFLRDCRNFLSI